MHHLDVSYDICTLPSLLSPAECAALVASAEAVGFADAPITTPFGFVHAPHVRNNTRVMVDDVAHASSLWARLSTSLEDGRPGWTAVGLNERFRYYRYAPGQRFAWHRDGAYVRDADERSHLTLMIYLNDDFVGGATEFDLDHGRLVVRPETGMALLFRHPVLHQGSAVVTGTKYVLRTDVMYRVLPDDPG